MAHQYHFTRISGNRKLGGLPASTTSSDSCPTRCSFTNGGGCYGEGGPVALHWKAVDARTRGGSLEKFVTDVKALPKHQLWRHNQVGDLPGDGVNIDAAALEQIVKANKGKHGFTFTHYDPLIPDNAKAISRANAAGFAINLSAETLAQADEYADLWIAPVVTVLPASAKRNHKTPQGRTVTVCPASIRDDVTCAHCAMCSEITRTHIIGFPAHGSGKVKVEKVFFRK